MADRNRKERTGDTVKKFISRSSEINTGNNEMVWAVTRDLVGQVLQEAQRGNVKPASGDLRVRLQYNAVYTRDEVLVTWDEVGG